MKLIAGLGNPGARYAATRHNVGFMAVDRIAHRHHFTGEQAKFDGLMCEGRIDGHKLLLFKPQTFMNRSGVPLSQIANFYKIPPEAVLVIYDELDLPVGRLRTKQGGGSGGHNGIKSCDAHFGKDYWRLRLGIDHPGDKARVSDYVLSDFTKDEQPVINAQLDALADHAGFLAGGDLPGFQNKIALAMQGFFAEK